MKWYKNILTLAGGHLTTPISSWMFFDSTVNEHFEMLQLIRADKQHPENADWVDKAHLTLSVGSGETDINQWVKRK